MDITKVVKPFIRRGWPDTLGNIVCVCVCVCVCCVECGVCVCVVWSVVCVCVLNLTISKAHSKITEI